MNVRKNDFRICKGEKKRKTEIKNKPKRKLTQRKKNQVVKKLMNNKLKSKHRKEGMNKPLRKLKMSYRTQEKT